MLALGGFPLVDLSCLSVAVIAAVVIYLTARESAIFLAQTILRQSPMATD